MSSRNLLMLGLAVLVGIGAWQVTQHKAPTKEVATSVLLPDLIDRVNAATQLAVTSNDGTVTVARNGEQWQVAEFDGFPAAVKTVKQALLQLAALRILETKTSKSEKYAQIGVEDRTTPGANSRAVKVSGPDGAVLVDLLIGKERPARAMNAPGHYVRRAGEASAYLVEGELSLPTKAVEWVDTAVVDLPVDRVRQVTVQPSEGSAIVVSKARPDVQLYSLADLPAGYEVRASATVSSIGGLLLDARFERVAKADRLKGLQPLSTATVETFDGLTARVVLYRTEEANYLTFEFLHTPDKAVTPPPAKPEEKLPADPTTPGPAPVPLKAPAEVAKEATDLNARTQGWAYVMPDYKSRLLDKRLEDLIKKSEAKPAPATR